MRQINHKKYKVELNCGTVMRRTAATAENGAKAAITRRQKPNQRVIQTRQGGQGEGKVCSSAAGGAGIKPGKGAFNGRQNRVQQRWYVA